MNVLKIGRYKGKIMAEKSYIYNVRSFDESEVKRIKALVKEIKRYDWPNNSTIMVHALEFYKKRMEMGEGSVIK